ncbi:MAG: pseudouridine synthase [Chloroflexi bacterium]|nr:pseudouridine synthase [Chloroflexota bacterium]
MKERVQKLMAQAGVASRRESEKLIEQGRVKVNGRVIHLGDQADPRTDIIEVDGEKLTFPTEHTYIAFYKPRNVLSTDDPHYGDTRKTVFDFVPKQGRLFSIGRLDAESEGLMVLTDDGDLANRLAHPRYRHSKTYKVVVYGLPTAETIQAWESGIYLTDDDTGETYKTAPCKVDITQGGKETTLRIVMTEGKKRQIRRVASALGHPVKSLLRTHIGKLGLGPLRPGEWRELSAEDVKAMKAPALELRRDQPARPRRAAPAKRAAVAPARRRVDKRDEADRPGRKPRRERRDTEEAERSPSRKPPSQRSGDDEDRPERPARKPRPARQDSEDDKPARRPGRRPATRRQDDKRKPGQPAGRRQQRTPGSSRRGRR